MSTEVAFIQQVVELEVAQGHRGRHVPHYDAPSASAKVFLPQSDTPFLLRRSSFTCCFVRCPGPKGHDEFAYVEIQIPDEKETKNNERTMGRSFTMGSPMATIGRLHDCWTIGRQDDWTIGRFDDWTIRLTKPLSSKRRSSITRPVIIQMCQGAGDIW